MRANAAERDECAAADALLALFGHGHTIDHEGATIEQETAAVGAVLLARFIQRRG